MKYPLLKAWAFMLLLSLSFAGRAQLPFDTVTHLREVVVEQSRLGSYAISKYTLKVDSLTHQLASASSLADLMRKYGYGHLRSYGPGGLATASFRGTGSSHTAVLWNGINLTSPLAGQVDLSHIPVSFIDDISMQSGGAASLYGNGSIGATIRLNNQARFNEGLTLSSRSSAGSFGTYYQDIGGAWSGGKFITSTRVFIYQADNDFPFLNKSITPARHERRDNTAAHQKGLLHQDYWQPAPNHLLTFKWWYQDDSYQVPNPTTVLSQANAVEKNTFNRSLLGYHFTHGWFDLNYQGAYVRHDLNYYDPQISPPNSLSRFNSAIQTLEGNFALAAQASLTTGVNYTWEEGIVDSFGGEAPHRNRVAFFSAFKWFLLKRWEVAAAAREELINGNTTPLAPSLTIKLKATPAWEVYASAARNYRIPTFNDLYWRGAGALGNPNLKPETSWSHEAGLRYTKPVSSNDWTLTFKAAAFSNSVKDWMLWNQVSAYWSPLNVKKVWARGIEAQASTQATISHTTLELQTQYTYTRSTNEDIYADQTSNELHKQLTFTPQHEGSVTARAYWRRYTLNALGSYTGKQYADGDNNNYNAIKAYVLASVWMSRAVTWKHLGASFTGEVNNLFDQGYQSRPGYPMPGRNYKLILSIKFNKPKST